MLDNRALQPLDFFHDVNGETLASGYIYYGEPDRDAEAYPITVYWDNGLSVPAAQPLRTIAGRVDNSGTPAAIYVGGDYSIKVKDSDGVTVYSILSARDMSLVLFPDYDSLDSFQGVLPDGAIMVDMESGNRYQVVSSGGDLTTAGGIEVVYRYRDYANPTTLLAANEPARGVGAQWQTKDGHNYKEAASGATDHHLTTAGGVKLYVVQDDAGFNVAAFGGVSNDDSVDNYSFIRSAISAALTLKQNTYSLPSIYFPSGIWTIKTSNVLGGFTAFSQTAGLNIVGAGYGSTSLDIETGGADTWLYQSATLADQWVGDLHFRNLSITTDDLTKGHCVYMTSNGTDKRPKFSNCNIKVGIVYQAEGTGNADLFEAVSCWIESSVAVLRLNNAQSVAHKFVNTNIIQRAGNVIEIDDAGGDISFINGSIQLIPTASTVYFIKKVGTTGGGLGNCNYIATNVRFELRDGGNLVYTPPSFKGPFNVMFRDCGLGNIQGAARNIVDINSVNTKVSIVGGTLAAAFQASVSADSADYGNNIASPGHLTIDSVFYGGSGTALQLSSQCAVTGNLARIDAVNITRSNIDGPLVPMSDSFVFGWPNRCHSQPPAPITRCAIMASGVTWPNTAITNTFRLPSGVYIKKIFLKRPSQSLTTAAYQLFVGNSDQTIVVGQSILGTYNDEHVIDVSDYGRTTWEDWAIWAVTASGGAFSDAPWPAYVEYY